MIHRKCFAGAYQRFLNAHNIIPQFTMATNNLVAESDLQVALAAIRNTIEQDATVPKELAQSLQESLLANIQRVVQPVTDDAFEQYVSRFETNENEDPDSSLVDQVAVDRLKELREQVRQEAARVQKLQQAAMETPQLQQTKLTVPTPAKPVIDTSSSQKQLEEMQQALQDMQVALKSTQTAIPKELTLLQQSMQAMESDLGRSLSQTEQALQVSENKYDKLSADQRVAQLFRD